MREPCGRAQRIPQSNGAFRRLRRRPQRFEAVAVAVDGVPEGDQAASFGEEQEEQAIDDRQRLFESVGHRRSRPMTARADERR
jgi:hypothetical protein